MENTKPKNEEVDVPSKSDSPFVFISHDTRDAEIAEAFSKLLKSVSAGMLKSFRSSDNKGTQGIRRTSQFKDGSSGIRAKRAVSII